MSTWASIPGWEGLYEVSMDGQIRSLPRNGKAGRTMRTFITEKGYRRVYLYRGDRIERVRVHTAVLRAFVGPRPAGMVTRHLDGDPANNHLSNLAWGTPAENEADKKRHALTRRAVEEMAA